MLGFFTSNKCGAKEGQDLFVDYLIPETGFYLDIGCRHPVYYNNTFILEKKGWEGVLLDHSAKHIDYCKAVRKGKSVCAKVQDVDWDVLMKQANTPDVIDYISLDVDDYNICFMENFPFQHYEFKIMTFETDYYSCGDKRKRVAEKILEPFGCYHKIVDNLQTVEGRSFEDWWVNTKFIDVGNNYRSNIRWNDFLKEIR